MGDGRLCSMGVEHSVWRRWSIDIPEDFVVVSEVLMVLICLSMKPLRSEDVILSMPRDVRKWEKGSEENGGPLSE